MKNKSSTTTELRQVRNETLVIKVTHLYIFLMNKNKLIYFNSGAL